MFLFLLLFTSKLIYASLQPPQIGAYQGAYADFGPMANEVTVERIKEFEQLSQKKMTWAYFANDWLNGNIEFPQKNVEACIEAHVIPYIRMMPWVESKTQATASDPVYSMDQFLSGAHDAALKRYARAAKASQVNLIIEFGPEVNGDWFPWNGKWNGGGQSNKYGDPLWPDGPEKFRDVYRRIINIFRAEGANNITWVFHVDVAWTPRKQWNEAYNYYPGDDYIDWIGLSVFGTQLPTSDWLLFIPTLLSFDEEINKMSLTKPLMISEFATIENEYIPSYKEAWIRSALDSIEQGIFPRIKGISYWNSPGWLSDGTANFKIDSSPMSLKAYQDGIRSDFWISQGQFNEM
jgi:beta-mannanase